MASPSPLPSPRTHLMQVDSPPNMQQGHMQPATNPSKRDKRRAAIAQALNDLNTNFQHTKDERYRTQLSILNAEMRAIAETNCHPDHNGMLPDFGGEVEEAINEVLKTSGVVLPSTNEKAGRFYSKFIDGVNDGVETRDVEMTELKFQHDRRLRNLHLHHDLALRHADAEYEHLIGNIRQRLLNRLGQNRKKLISEKDNLDASEPAFAYLHPAQFATIQSERSPAGRQGLADVYSSLEGAPTRKLRGRKGDDPNNDPKNNDYITILQTLENSGIFSGNGGSHGSQSPGGAGTKRKRGNNRKARETDDGFLTSFTEISRPSTPRSADPSQKSRNGANGHTEFIKPLYSLDKLFTDREIAGATSAAQAATVKHYMELYSQRLNEEDGLVDATSQGGAIGPAGFDTPSRGDDTPMEDEGNGAPHGPVTRNFTSAAAALVGHNMTPIIPPSFLTKGLTAPPPAGLRPEESNGDLEEIRRLKAGGAPSSTVNGTLIGRSATPLARSLSGIGGVSMSRGDNLSTMSSRRGARDDDDNLSVTGSGRKNGLGLGITATSEKKSGRESKKQQRAV